MRASGPYEVKLRQLRALVLLLMLLPLIPTAFVARFMYEAISFERVEARDRERPIYQKFLDAAGASLVTNITRKLAEDPRALSDAVVSVGPDGRLAPELPGARPSALAAAAIESGARVSASPNRGGVRWRFLCEAAEPIFALSPDGAATPILLLKTRSHLLESLRAYYSRALDPKSVLVLLDENGESVPLNEGGAVRAGEPLAEAALKAPLPQWRVQLFAPGASLVDAASREQLAFYFWTIVGVLAVTVAIGGLAGLALSRRIILRELSNDALAVMSHEMKTPLASVRMFVETLLDRHYAGGKAQADQYLRLIAQENRRMERLIEGIAMLSRIERGGGRLIAPEIIEVTGVVAAARSQLQARLDAVDFAARLEEGLPPIRGDADALTAVLVNLLDNALKYSGPEPHVRLNGWAAGANVVLEVSDRGPGIAAGEQEKIFERFYQVDQTLSRSQEGLGLGLSIVRSIVRAHGGEVTVASAPGKGSTFTVRLPKAG